ncbi:hypothetical protein [Sinorhizobium meliloti]|uniref:hypothetical protein n=1 Tax=Rhizobium meliloti TaxID=382 RepID=UPI000FD50B27|nr:hypothetical protein [Sinorhizobium meliloti]RVL87801.1 hypothetical protein CN136_37610 [Sinorhizobium meliloti]RVN80556.1 hypothetical protein CN101_33265 [Sinorhizobium meliloti]RVO49000.1 hypothetical protein CN094_34410 [Sinorhizobium meliloti]
MRIPRSKCRPAASFNLDLVPAQFCVLVLRRSRFAFVRSLRLRSVGIWRGDQDEYLTLIVAARSAGAARLQAIGSLWKT